ncbi:MAG TPA: hypothetical protein VK935_03540 [Actinomycetospora sp.]|nr:hypothetical protein [Actinomycetospora sp.]
MTAPYGTGAGPEGWLDMSRYPDTDPDTALTGQEQDLLSTSLAVDDTELPDAVWEHMLAVVTGADDGADTEVVDDAGPEPDDAAVDTWAIDGDGESPPDDHDPAFDAGDDATGEDGAWDAGAV